MDNEEQLLIPGGKFKQTSVSDLISQCNHAVSRMGNKNSYKQLLFNCALALRQMSDRLAKWEDDTGRPQ